MAIRKSGKYVLEEAKERADQIIDESNEFQNYLTLIRDKKSVQTLTGEKDPRWPGAWKAVRKFQEQLLDEPLSMERDEEMQDENPMDTDIHSDIGSSLPAHKRQRVTSSSDNKDGTGVQPLASPSTGDSHVKVHHEAEPTNVTTTTDGRKRSASITSVSQNTDEVVVNSALIAYLNVAADLGLEGSTNESQ